VKFIAASVRKKYCTFFAKRTDYQHLTDYFTEAGNLLLLIKEEFTNNTAALLQRNFFMVVLWLKKSVIHKKKKKKKLLDCFRRLKTNTSVPRRHGL